jgi:hypothetical protein
MTDYSELVKQLRQATHGFVHHEAADALEEQAKEIAEKDARIAELEAEVRFAYLECEDAVQCYDYEADLLRTDFEGLSENVRHMIKAMRDTAIPKNRYQNIRDNQAAWQRMLAARAALKGEAK